MESMADTDPAELEARMAAVEEFNEGLKSSGAFVHAGGFIRLRRPSPSTAPGVCRSAPRGLSCMRPPTSVASGSLRRPTAMPPSSGQNGPPRRCRAGSRCVSCSSSRDQRAGRARRFESARGDRPCGAHDFADLSPDLAQFRVQRLLHRREHDAAARFSAPEEFPRERLTSEGPRRVGGDAWSGSHRPLERRSASPSPPWAPLGMAVRRADGDVGRRCGSAHIRGPEDFRSHTVTTRFGRWLR